ncbi:TPA: hypothetical protein ACV5ZF_002604 [Salmonella enterica]|uniref:Uncharacterized protein n=2 Tax=Salmonella enterica TaxID=28901 RepID=A0A3V8I3Z2_SALER|nr:hypothetical protein [Salmonella enterica]ECC9156150.1 hypothetical protein [Salmonella enterica subsp. salamae]AZT23361.1 hypothetical protein ELZ76_05145 [Salmonella enterica subsp. salamae serovar 42:r:-]AZT49741.1 hypothetical protein EL003_05165 [Salmonella enterica subsp. salamae serovar 42:r:-]AZT54020.1 hypothetical protein EL009_05180 [Salmonella enterica subsp. salamae serovar 42:r:-]EAA9058416.1 hypothetical protein [Salmonella enterica]
MSIVATLRDLSEVWQLFGNMPDDTTLNVDLAALYLGISVKTLARYRQNGGGPEYIQYQSEDSKARNQRVNYLLKDLKVWRDAHKVKNSMEAAQVRGLAFNSLIDFTIEQPFWRIDNELNSDNQNKILSHVLRTPEERFKIYLAEKHIKIVWISVEKALLLDWTDLTERQVFHDSFVNFLDNSIQLSTAVQENLVLNNIFKK